MHFAFFSPLGIMRQLISSVELFGRQSIMGPTEDPASHREPVTSSAMTFPDMTKLVDLEICPFTIERLIIAISSFGHLGGADVECDGPARTRVLGKV
jgi:hypothetical protein